MAPTRRRNLVAYVGVPIDDESVASSAAHDDEDDKNAARDHRSPKVVFFWMCVCVGMFVGLKIATAGQPLQDTKTRMPMVARKHIRSEQPGQQHKERVEHISDSRELEGEDGDEDDIVPHLTRETYDHFLAHNQHAFIFYYASYIGTDQIVSQWRSFADRAKRTLPVRVAMVECAEQTEVCSMNNITFYPTMRWFEGGKSTNDFQGSSRTAANFVSFSLKMLFGVVSLTGETHDDFLANNQHTFILYYAPLSSIKRSVLPVWESFGEQVDYEGKLPLRVAKVDCVAQWEVCSKNGVMAYPTMRWIEGGNTTDYRGDRTVDSFMGFSRRMLGVDVAKLTGKTFDDFLIQNQHAFILFYSQTWSRHAPVWKEFGERVGLLKDEMPVRVAVVDCMTNHRICGKNHIQTFPTRRWFEGGQHLQDYKGDHTVRALMSYCLKMLRILVRSPNHYN